MRTWKIEMKMDFEDESKYEIMRQMAREAARTMLATAMFLKDKREPRITITDFDPFNGDTVIEIDADIVTTLQGNEEPDHAAV